MNATKTAKPQDGLTAAPLAGAKSSPVMTDGDETPEMLLALLNNALVSMINSQQARIMGTALNRGRRATVIIVYGVEPTANNSLRAVGNMEEKK